MNPLVSLSLLVLPLVTAQQHGPPGGPPGGGFNIPDIGHPISSWAAAHTSDWSSLGSQFSSWTSAAGVTSLPTASSQWASLTSAHPLPSQLSSIAGAGTAWGGPQGAGHPGWNPGAGLGPFGAGMANGWGPWATISNRPWTSGPWTAWWGTNACPPSTWSGWTSGPWASGAPWTTWSACTASTTATSVITATITTGGTQSVQTTTSFGVKVAQASGDLSSASGGNSVASGTSSSGSSTTANSAAAPNHSIGVAAAGFAVIGLLVGCIAL
ncbi:hypothetical protein K470DRAFT_223510 [Piedraia hortae CBS 480.64]|uniref:Uncharacterized protein n=1 Tax=Piedraia hortae CBS 480.64 TaxID=1314780 RepID=A0A6A7BRP9_9PEZI|nr:hypothetical protein K470DRAFT_223510 [Piedraia hortae CBS 480.64]